MNISNKKKIEMYLFSLLRKRLVRTTYLLVLNLRLSLRCVPTSHLTCVSLHLLCVPLLCVPSSQVNNESLLRYLCGLYNQFFIVKSNSHRMIFQDMKVKRTLMILITRKMTTQLMTMMMMTMKLKVGVDLETESNE